MLLAFPGSRGTSEEAELILSAYVNVLGDMPPWAVDDAARRWARGQVAGSNPAFAPSAAQVHQVCAGVIEPLMGEVIRLKRVLGGTVVERPLVGYRSPERRRALEEQATTKAARESLSARASELGLDPAEVLASIPNAAPRTGTLQTLDAALVGALKPMPTDEGQA